MRRLRRQWPAARMRARCGGASAVCSVSRGLQFLPAATAGRRAQISMVVCEMNAGAATVAVVELGHNAIEDLKLTAPAVANN